VKKLREPEMVSQSLEPLFGLRSESIVVAQLLLLVWRARVAVL
jgi:hypothetical protein